MVIDHKASLLKEGYGSDVYGNPLIHLNMIPSESAKISVQESILRQDNEII